MVLDLVLLGMSGYAFTDAYRTLLPPHAAIIVLTGFAHDTGRIAVSTGAVGVVPKPFDVPVVARLVAHHAAHSPIV